VIGPTTHLELSWKSGTSATSHKIYAGTHLDELGLLAERKVPRYQFNAQLEKGATYYWRVDEVQANGSVVAGDVWSFTIGKLIGWWKLDGDTKDSSGNNNRGTIVGDPGWVAGRIGSALEFDGVDDYVSIGESADFVLGDQGTIGLWVRTNDAGNGEVNPYITHCKYGLKHKDFNALEFYIFTDTWRVVRFDVSDSFNGDWHHLAGTYDDSELKLYIDGTLEGTTSYDGTMGTETSNITIGAEPEPSGGQYYRGGIDDVRIYNYALSDEGIQRLCQGVASSEPGEALPAFRSQIYDNSALDLETGAAVTADAVPEAEWPTGFDVAWDNDGGGALMVGPGSGARIVGLSGVKEGNWEEAISMGRKARGILRTSKAKGIIASQSGFTAVLTSEENLAVIRITDYDEKGATLFWHLE
jgi:hypothetical protein